MLWPKSDSNPNRLAISDKPEVGIIVALQGGVAHPDQAALRMAHQLFPRRLKPDSMLPPPTPKLRAERFQFLNESDEFRRVGPEVECRAEAFEQAPRFTLPLWIALLHLGRGKHLIERVAPWLRDLGIVAKELDRFPVPAQKIKSRADHVGGCVEALDERDQMGRGDLLRKC